MAAGLIKFNTWLTKPNPFSIGTLISMYEDFIKHPCPLYRATIIAVLSICHN
jgi:phosphoribosyl 1,2-cyclic phosphodiesterase